MPDLDVLTWSRALERLISCSFAGVALVLGYKLFKMGVVDPQSGELKGKAFSVKLQRCAPGIFFALFGTGIFLWMLSSPLVISTRPAPVPLKSSTNDSIGLSFLGVAPDENRKKTIGALNRIETTIRNWIFTQNAASGSTETKEFQDLERALTILQRFKEALLIEKFGSERVAFYKEHLDKFRKNELGPSEAERAIMTAVDEMATTMDSEL